MLDFAVAVGTQKYALLGLRTESVERVRDALTAESEALALRIEMVELERTKVASITAKHALPSRFIDENRLCSPTTLRYPLRPTSFAPI